MMMSRRFWFLLYYTVALCWFTASVLFDSSVYCKIWCVLGIGSSPQRRWFSDFWLCLVLWCILLVSPLWQRTKLGCQPSWNVLFSLWCHDGLNLSKKKKKQSNVNRSLVRWIIHLNWSILMRELYFRGKKKNAFVIWGRGWGGGWAICF